MIGLKGSVEGTYVLSHTRENENSFDLQYISRIADIHSENYVSKETSSHNKRSVWYESSKINGDAEGCLRKKDTKNDRETKSVILIEWSGTVS